MRVASLESAVAAVTLITAIIVVLWEIKIFYGLWTGRMPRQARPSIPSAAAEACRSSAQRSQRLPWRTPLLDHQTRPHHRRHRPARPGDPVRRDGCDWVEGPWRTGCPAFAGH